MPEYALTRNYLDLMVELPWSKSTKGKWGVKVHTHTHTHTQTHRCLRYSKRSLISLFHQNWQSTQVCCSQT